MRRFVAATREGCSKRLSSKFNEDMHIWRMIENFFRRLLSAPQPMVGPVFSPVCAERRARALHMRTSTLAIDGTYGHRHMPSPYSVSETYPRGWKLARCVGAAPSTRLSRGQVIMPASGQQRSYRDRRSSARRTAAKTIPSPDSESLSQPPLCTLDELEQVAFPHGTRSDFGRSGTSHRAVTLLQTLRSTKDSSAAGGAERAGDLSSTHSPGRSAARAPHSLSSRPTLDRMLPHTEMPFCTEESTLIANLA